MPLIDPEQLTLGETTFMIGKLPATDGWDLAADVANLLADREIPAGALVGAMGAKKGSPEMIAAGAGILKAVATIPRHDLRRIRDALFGGVEFTNRLARTPQVLKGREEAAFNAVGLGGVDVWKVLAKAFQVNFMDYWDELKSLTPENPITTQ